MDLALKEIVQKLDFDEVILPLVFSEQIFKVIGLSIQNGLSYTKVLLNTNFKQVFLYSTEENKSYPY